jgi:UDP-2,3-diacylglucosamine pyrophosphatase LpxH
MNDTAIKVRSIFLSDIHLGTRGCQAERLLEFLKWHEAEYLFLLGDIIDFWAMRRGVHWSPMQNTVIQKVLRRVRHGEQVFLIPGNHDEALREHDGIEFGGIRIVREHVHTTADGRRFLLIHGDEFDQVTRHHRWVALLGDVSYDALVRINAWLSWLRRKLNIPGYWSLAGYAKRKVKTAVSFIFDFEDSVIHAVRDLRSYSLCLATSSRAGDLHQLRRLGGQLHRGDRAPGRQNRTGSPDFTPL